MKRDIVIAGGGMVGVSLALALAARLPAAVSITLVESFPLHAATDSTPEYHPSFDARSTALSYGSRLIYEELGLWQALAPWMCPIETIHVSNRGRFGSTLLCASEYDWPALGYVVENAWLGSSLLCALNGQDRVELLSPATVASAKALDSGVELTLSVGSGEAEKSGDKTMLIQAGLLLVADGAGSGLRQALGVTVDEKPYGQSAVIANIETSESHKGCAFERFTDEGPLALLPLCATADAAHRSALVWTLPPERAEELQHCEEALFLETLQARFGYRLGRLRKVGERHCYPLSLVQSGEQVRQAVVVMGNAAHALHPVAGQGFNLALRDVAALSQVLATGLAQGQAPGDLSCLQRYEAQQRADQERTIGFSDQVPGLFMQADPLLGLGRDLALAGLDVMPALKGELVRYAAGIADRAAPGNG